MKPIVKAAFFLVALVAITLAVSHGIAFAAETAPVDTVKETIPWWAIAALVAGVVGEILSLIPSLKSNGIVQLVLNVLGYVKNLGSKKD